MTDTIYRKPITQMNETELHAEAARRIEDADRIARNLMEPMPDHLTIGGITVQRGHQREFAEHLRDTARTITILAASLA